jgi:hypothetical protein
MPHPLIHCALTMVMLCTTTPAVRSTRPLVCLPDGIKPDTVVTSERVRSERGVIGKAITVSQMLMKLSARCKHGKLVDGKGRSIHFYRLIGCWGNPPADYQDLLEKQNRELNRLKKKYTVIEIPCSQGVDPRRISL